MAQVNVDVVQCASCPPGQARNAKDTNPSLHTDTDTSDDSSFALWAQTNAHCEGAAQGQALLISLQQKRFGGLCAWGGGSFSSPNNRFIRDISPSKRTACSRSGDNWSALIKAGFDGSDFLLRCTFSPLLVSSELSDGIMKAMLSFSDGVHFKLEPCSPLFFFFFT